MRQFRLWTSLWKIVFVKHVPGKRGEFVGECNFSHKTIRIDKKLSGRDKIDTLIHEMLHAVLPEKSELWVNSVASDMAQVLAEFGIKDVKEAKPKSSKQSS